MSNILQPPLLNAASTELRQHQTKRQAHSAIVDQKTGGGGTSVADTGGGGGGGGGAIAPPLYINDIIGIKISKKSGKETTIFNHKLS